MIPLYYQMSTNNGIAECMYSIAILSYILSTAGYMVPCTHYMRSEISF